MLAITPSSASPVFGKATTTPVLQHDVNKPNSNSTKTQALPPFIVKPNLKFDSTPDAKLSRPPFSVTAAAGYFEHLRQLADTDTILANSKTPLEKLTRLSQWTQQQWPHNGYNSPKHNDPIGILNEVRETGKPFKCVQYAAVLTGLLNAIGIPSRTLSLSTCDVETRRLAAGHVATEAYIAVDPAGKRKKWVFADPQMGIVPTLHNEPLSAVELQQALERGDNVTYLGNPVSKNPHWGIGYKQFIQPLLYYFQVPLTLHYKPGSVSGRRLKLGPIGAHNPTHFQGEKEPVLPLFTHSVKSFYQAPPSTPEAQPS